MKDKLVTAVFILGILACLAIIVIAVIKVSDGSGGTTVSFDCKSHTTYQINGTSFNCD